MSTTTPEETKTKARLYVGTYNKYNNGSIKGAWLDLEDYADATEFFAACEELHKNESDPELMFQDFEGFPKELYSESANIQNIEKIYDWLSLDANDRELVEEYAEATGSLPDDWDNAIESYVTTIDHDEDYDSLGRYYLEECDGLQDVPKHLINYIDFASYGRDCAMDCSISKNGFVFNR